MVLPGNGMNTSIISRTINNQKHLPNTNTHKRQKGVIFSRATEHRGGIESYDGLFGPAAFMSLLTSDPVVRVDLRTDVADGCQQGRQHSFTVLPEAALDLGHPGYSLTIHLHRTVTMGAKGSSFFTFKLLFSLKSILFDFSLSFLFGLFQTTVFTLAGLGHLLCGSFLGLQQLLDALGLTRHFLNVLGILLVSKRPKITPTMNR